MSAARAEMLGRIRSALGAAPVVPDVPRDYHPAGTAAVDLDRFCERVADYRATVHRVSQAELGAALAEVAGRLGLGRVGTALDVELDGVELVRDEPPLSIADLDGLDGVLTGCALGIAETGTLVLDGAGRSGRRALTLVPDVHLCVIAEDQVVASVPDAVRLACVEHGARRLAVPGDLPAAWRAEGVEWVEDDGLTNAQLDAVDGALTGCAVGIAETGTLVLDGGERQGRRALSLLPDLHLCVIDEEQVVGSVPEGVARLGAVVRAAGRPLTFVSGPSATSDIELDRVEGVHGPRTLEVLVVSAR